MAEEAVYGPDGKLKKREVLKYNADGDRTQTDRYDGSGTLTEKELWTYSASGDRSRRASIAVESGMSMMTTGDFG